MGFSFFTRQFVLDTYTEGEGDVWEDEPTEKGTIIYSVVTPVLCVFGICGNTLSLLVLRRKELNGSVYTYLSVLALMDLLSSIILFLGGLSKGALWHKGWASYDALVGLPLGGAINFLCICSTVFVTIDRVIFLWDSSKCTKPAFCKQKIARRVMCISLIISILFSVPYCFIFRKSPDGGVVTTSFFDSKLYIVHNWTCFIIFSIVPSVILIIGNGFLIRSLRQAHKIGTKCNSSRSKKKDHRNLTIILILIILIFLVSEIPANLVSRTSAVNLIFQGDHDKANTKTVEIIRQVTTLIGAISITMNFVLYYLFCPPFCKILMKMIRGKRRRSTLQVNVFVVNNYDDQKKCSLVIKDKVLRIDDGSLETSTSMPSTLFGGKNSADCTSGESTMNGTNIITNSTTQYV